ncbi:MAG: EF-P lysine aminoacylase GenX [Chromatiales bacterium]|nr:EF-P lysine aminoacylase GenX [Chromatiales bacterium]
MTTGAWRAGASKRVLLARAQLLSRIRAFFVDRGLLEVETPSLAGYPVTDPHIECIKANVAMGGARRTLYLQSSPEYAMKRLLASGSGPIFQICKAFRDGEVGRAHNIEFTMLEWYRPGFDHRRLMAETGALLCTLTEHTTWRVVRYAKVFQATLGVDPHDASDELLKRCAARHTHVSTPTIADLRRVDLLELLFSQAIQPTLKGLQFVYDFPSCLSALAKVYPGTPPVAARFEGYLDGAEVANGYHELADPVEQRARMAADQTTRRLLGLPTVPIDELLLAAVGHGIGDVAGVAVGVDRVVAASVRNDSLDGIMAFAANRLCARLDAPQAALAR